MLIIFFGFWQLEIPTLGRHLDRETLQQDPEVLGDGRVREAVVEFLFSVVEFLLAVVEFLDAVDVLVKFLVRETLQQAQETLQQMNR